MKRKSFLILFFSFVLVFSVVCLCAFVIPVSADEEKSENHIQISQSENGTISDSSNEEELNTEQIESGNLSYYIGEQGVTKTLETSGETTIFKLTFSLFIKNGTSSETKFLSKGFWAKYMIAGNGTLLESACVSSDDNLTVSAGSTLEVEFEVKYVISSDDFNYNDKYELVIGYISEQIYSVEL